MNCARIAVEGLANEVTVNGRGDPSGAPSALEGFGTAGSGNPDGKGGVKTDEGAEDSAACAAPAGADRSNPLAGEGFGFAAVVGEGKRGSGDGGPGAGHPLAAEETDRQPRAKRGGEQ